MTRKTIGVLGGMGPSATLELFERIINNTVAHSDQEHVSLIIINDPGIPDRTNYILGKGPSPIPKLNENLTKLKKAGADAVVIPCMTAHTFIDELQDECHLPIINAIDLVNSKVKKSYSQVKKIGIMATTGSVTSRVFNRFVQTELVYPTNAMQNVLMDSIYDIKAGKNLNEVRELLKPVVQELIINGAEAIVAGCTELSLVLNENDAKIPILDPINMLAEKVVKLGTSNYRVINHI